MKKRALPAWFLAGALILQSGCSSSGSEGRQEKASTAPDSTVATGTPSRQGVQESTRPADPKLDALVCLFPELPLPSTLTLTGDTFDKAAGKTPIKPPLDEMRDFLGFEFSENGYKDSFLSITPLGKISTASGVLLVYISDWDGSCPTLSSSFLPHSGGPRTLDLQQTSCGPCQVITGSIIFSKETVTKKMTKSDDCENEGRPSTQVSETTFTLQKEGLTLTKETPWVAVK